MWPKSDREQFQIISDFNIWLHFTVQSDLTMKQKDIIKSKPVMAELDGISISVQCQQILVQSPSLFSCDGFYSRTNWEC